MKFARDESLMSSTWIPSSHPLSYTKDMIPQPKSKRRWSLKSVSRGFTGTFRPKASRKGIETKTSNSVPLSRAKLAPLRATERTDTDTQTSSHSTPSSAGGQLTLPTARAVPILSSHPRALSPLPSLSLSLSSSHPQVRPASPLHPPSPLIHTPPSNPNSVAPTAGSRSLYNTELELDDLESDRAAILLRKGQAEVSMHDSAQKLHTYQKEFEVHQRAFVAALTELQDVDDRLSKLRKEKGDVDATVFPGVESDVVNQGHLENQNTLQWLLPPESDSESDTDSDW